MVTVLLGNLYCKIYILFGQTVRVGKDDVLEKRLGNVISGRERDIETVIVSASLFLSWTGTK